MDVLKQLLDDARRLLRDMTTTQRAAVVTMIVTVGMLLFFMVFLGSLGHDKNMIPLPMSVAPGDAEEIQKRLSSQGVSSDYRIELQRLLIPAADRDKAIMFLARENILTRDAGSGFEDMIRAVSVMDPQDIVGEKMNIALQNEVAWMIESLDDIKSARVVYSAPQRRRLFTPPSRERASVKVEMALGRTMGQPLADTIIRLVAYARTGLDPKDVMVSDQTGRNFLLAEDDSIDQIAIKQQDLNRRKNEETRRKVEDVIRAQFRSTPIDVFAFIDTEYDLTLRETRARTVLAGPAASTIRRKVSDASTSRPAAPVGEQPNIRRATNMDAGPPGMFTERTYNETSTETRNQHGYQETLERPDPTIRKQTISVVVHLPYEWKRDAEGNFVTVTDEGGRAVIDPETRQPKRERVPVPPLAGAELTALYNSVARAAGILEGAENREIEITQVPWIEPLHPDVLRDDAATQIMQVLKSNVMPILLLMSILAAVYFLYIQAKRALPAEKHMMQTAEEESFGPAPMSEEEKANVEFEHLRGQVGEIVADDPSKAASIVRRWMVHREGF